MSITVRQCPVCEKPFVPALRSPGAKLCSKRCRNRQTYLNGKGATKQRRPVGRVAPKKPRVRAYDPVKAAEYQQRPEVKARNAARNRARYVPHPRAPRQKPVAPPEVLNPYTGHQWLEKARAAVGSLPAVRATEWADRKEDEMGEALLALLEGQDPVEAVKAYRRREFVPRHLTQSISEWQGSSEEAWRVDTIDQLAVPSAEEEVVAKETVLRKVRYHGGQGKGLMGTPKQQSRSGRVRNAA